MSKPTKIDKKLSTFSERVKMMDMHPTEPLVLCSLYSGQVTLWNYETKSLVKSFEILDAPVRCVKFIVKLQSFACGADDMNIRVFNYNTMEKTKTFTAHDDYLRSIAVHDQLPIMLTSSDDMRIKAWDWTRDWACTMIFEGHQHYVMAVAFNPKDAMTFASASLDTTVKVWNLASPEPNYSLAGHEDGVNCVEYYPGGDKPYLVSGSDDHTVKVWDYQTRSCIQTLTHHVHNVTAAFFHPDVPLLFTGGEDEIVGVVNTQTWRTEQTLNYGMQRVWTFAARQSTHHLAIGYDRGMVVLKCGSDEPVLTMDANGKLYMAVGSDISRFDVKNIAPETPDGEALRVASKELGTSEARPIAIAHGPSGQNIAVMSDTEYTVYSAIAWRAKSFGPCLSFAWGRESGSYAVLESPTVIKLFKGLKAGETVTLPEPADKLFSGPLLAVRTAGAITFLDWDSLRVVRRIEARPNAVTWCDSHELVALILDSSFYILRYNAEVAAEMLPSCTDADGVAEAFEAVDEGEETIRQASWVGDCLCFINQSDRLNYYIGGEYTTVAVLHRGTHLLGYLPKENRLVCIDRDRNISSYLLHVSVVEYKGAIVREAFDDAAEVLPRIPHAARDKVAQFLQSRGHLEIALEVATEDDHRFDLAVSLGRLETALAIGKKIPSAARWRQIGDMALEQAVFDVAEAAMAESGDLNGLLMLYTSTGNAAGLRRLGTLALQKGKTNVAFTCCHLLSDYSACTEILLQTNRVADAAFYARTYSHDKVDGIVQRWKNTVAALPRVRDSIADPAGFPNLFPNMADSIAKKKAATATVAAAEEEEASPARAPATADAGAALASPANLFSPDQPRAPATTPATSYRPADAAAAADAGNLFSPDQPRAPATTPATSYRPNASASAAEATPDNNGAHGNANGYTPTANLFSPDQPRVPDTTPVTVMKHKPTVVEVDTDAAGTPSASGAAAAGEFFSPDQPRVPDTTPATSYRPNVSASAAEVEKSASKSASLSAAPAAVETPIVARAAAVAAAAAADSPSNRLDYSPERHVDPVPAAEPEPEPEEEEVAAPAAPAAAAKGPSVTDDEDLDAIFGDDYADDAAAPAPAVAASPSEKPAAAPAADGFDDDEDPFGGDDDEDWN